jgi:hypothetical protein
MDQLKVIQEYTERAETAFREMFDDLLALVEEGKVERARHELATPRQEAINVIERMQQSLAE